MTAEKLRERIAKWEAYLAQATAQKPFLGREYERGRVVDTCERVISGLRRRLARLEGKE